MLEALIITGLFILCVVKFILQQFVVWQYNAHIHGLIDLEFNKALPGIDRGQTD